MSVDVEKISKHVQLEQKKFLEVRDEIGKVIVGQAHLINQLLIAILSDGHLILEGVPGLAKTLAVTTLAKTLACDFKRIQFTPDLLPADLIGTSIFLQNKGEFQVKKGPIFTNILLADEINRAPAKVQSALLEAMQERQATISGETFPIPQPYLVLATQNPIEQSGTYPLPEAQTDRFMMKIKIDYPTIEEEKEIIERMGTLGPKPAAETVLNTEEILNARKVVNSIYIDESVLDYLLNIVFATRNPKHYGANITNLLEFGASPRASISLKIGSKASAFMQGRGYVLPQDVIDLAYPVLRHRLKLSYEAEAEEITPDQIITRILDSIPVP